jgi:hypothetical protein
MVQPLSPTPSVSGPNLPAASPPKVHSSIGKHEKFNEILRRLTDTMSRPATGAEEPRGPEAREPHQKHRITVSEELPAGLAPEGEASLGGRGLDLAEWLAVIQPAGVDTAGTPPAAVSAPPGSPAELSGLVERWVKRIALGGEQRRGVARLDIGGGRFAGAELLVIAEEGKVSVELSLPAEASAPGIAERLRSRLERRGLSAEVVVR